LGVERWPGRDEPGNRCQNQAEERAAEHEGNDGGSGGSCNWHKWAIERKG